MSRFLDIKKGDKNEKEETVEGEGWKTNISMLRSFPRTCSRPLPGQFSRKGEGKRRGEATARKEEIKAGGEGWKGVCKGKEEREGRGEREGKSGEGFGSITGRILLITGESFGATKRNVSLLIARSGLYIPRSFSQRI